MPGVARRLLDGFVSAVSSSSDMTQSDRQRVVEAIKKARDDEPPPTLVIIGEAGVGKTTTINSLFNAGQPVSARRATTLHAVSMLVEGPVDELLVNGARGLLRVFDMPGLGDRMSTYRAYRSLYLEVLPQADVVLWVHPAEDRMIQFVQTAVQDMFGSELPHMLPRLTFGLNKADRISPDDWNRAANVPSDEQLENLRARETDFTQVIREALPAWRGSAVTYSAWTRYKLTSLFKQMIYAVPEARRWVLEDRMSLASFVDLVDKGILRAAMEKAQPSPSGPTTPTQDLVPDTLATVGLQHDVMGREALARLKALSPHEYKRIAGNPEQLIYFLYGDPEGRHV